MPPNRISLSGRTWAALGGAFVIVTLLLALTAVTLISQRQRTVLLNNQLGTLVGEATLVLHATEPALRAAPGRSSTIRSRANAVAHLVSRAGPLIDQLSSTSFPNTLAATGQLIASLQQQNRLSTTLDDVDALAAAANRGGLVNRFGALLDQIPAAARLIGQLGGLAAGVQSYQLVPRAAGGLNDLRRLVSLQAAALRVLVVSLGTQRATRDIARQTLSTAQATLASAQQTLIVAEQTLGHAANLDRKVGPVP